ncbi:hypothetical protein ACL2XP_04660 [Sodalis sp. RH21]
MAADWSITELAADDLPQENIQGTTCTLELARRAKKWASRS